MFKRKDSVSSKTELLDESLDAIVVKYKAELDELGEKFPVLKDDPFLLYRFIRARPNLKQSAEMISNFLVNIVLRKFVLFNVFVLTGIF